MDMRPESGFSWFARQLDAQTTAAGLLSWFSHCLQYFPSKRKELAIRVRAHPAYPTSASLPAVLEELAKARAELENLHPIDAREDYAFQLDVLSGLYILGLIDNKTYLDLAYATYDFAHDVGLRNLIVVDDPVQL